MKLRLLIFVIYTLFLLYIGLWSEIAGRIKFNQWDIIGARGRITNHNLYSNIYILGLGLILFLFVIKNLANRFLK